MAYATLDELKNRLRIPLHDGSQDEWLQTLLDSADISIEQLAGGRRFAVDTEETRGIDCSREFVLGRILRLPWEMHTISAVVNGDGVAVGATEFVTLPRLASIVDGAVIAPTATNLTARPFYEIHLKASSAKTWTYTDDWELAISVTGYFGYSSAPPAPIRVAALDLAVHMYKVPEVVGRAIVSPDGMLLTPDAFPSHVRDLVEPFRGHV